jgi:arylsulfatase A
MWPKVYKGKQTHRYWDPDRFEDGTFHPRAKGVFGPDQECDYLIHFMTEKKDKPWLAYWPMTLIHGPLEDPPGFDAKEKPDKGARFAANVRTIDRLVGRIVDAIDQLGLGNKTLILFTCDNGTVGGIRSRLGDRVIRGGKGQVNDAGTRVPLVARWTDTIQPGAVSQDLIDFSDFLPTLAELSGGKVPTDRVIDGRSFAPQLRGEAGKPREWVYLQNAGRIIVRGKRFHVNPQGQLFELADRYAPKLITPEQATDETDAIRKRLIAGLESVRGDAGVPAKKGRRRKRNR